MYAVSCTWKLELMLECFVMYAAGVDVLLHSFLTLALNGAL
jgi:hypothetical protein